MKYIRKNESPVEFEKWKRDSHGSVLEGKGWIEFVRNRKLVASLKKSIIEEQGYICCYCESRVLNNHQTSIEHFYPQSKYPELVLEYSNLLASCNIYEEQNGNEQLKLGKKEIHCNAHRKNNELFINPLNPECENYLQFNSIGEIFTSEKKVKNDINVLNLNAKRLVLQRKLVIETFIYNENNELIENEEAEKILALIYNRDEQEQFIEHCSAVRSMLKQII